MIKFFTTMILFFIAIFWAANVFSATEAHGPARGPGVNFIYVIVNFCILMGLLYWKLKKPAREFFRTRSIKTRQFIDNAKKEYDAIYRKYEEIEVKLNNADVESENLIHSVKKEADKEKQKIISLAKEMSEKIKSDSRRIADQEIVRAKELLKAETVRLAAELAADKIQKQITPEIQVRLGSEFVRDVQRVG